MAADSLIRSPPLEKRRVHAQFRITDRDNEYGVDKDREPAAAAVVSHAWADTG